MEFSIILRLLVFVLAVTWVSGASIERFESESPAQTAVIDLLEVLNERRSSEEHKQVEYEEEDDEYYYNEDEEEDEFSGDYNVPLVAFSSKPKDQSAVLDAERLDGSRRKGLGRKKGKGKGKGKKRNPCLIKYKDFCIHGTCKYLRDIKKPLCICDPGYSGERCHSFSLEVRTEESGYNRTTALAVVAVVLSTLCLTIIGLLLALRFHKRGAYNVENEEKIKLGAAPHH
ncbi:heparin-binding EGF-like growth factor a [Triplophysa rosa]|uniref:Proheparin-binding EGF-like growth factor n=1 Tax=Triplophysa rosa TaxID=992332 RepID=A0A9W7WJV3_TRIRA|nr:heparin-binding EGF-like growth factor a [Triplophysa rosa]KAI7801615.1 heparin-binding EGF-like growth factor precursor [Triplophysa rosa]